MRKRIDSIIIFYVLYFLWLALVIMLWPTPKYLTYFLLSIAAFYFVFLYEKMDFWFFAAVYLVSLLAGKYLVNDPTFANRGYPPLGIPFWPIAWGITVLAFRKFYILLNKGYKT